MKKYKTTDLALLKRKLTTVFNQFIRLRDCGGAYGYCKCISCPNVYSYGDLQAGHFWSAGAYPAIRWDERNVNAQCGGCNTFKHGNHGEYRIGLLEKLGEEEVDQLEQERNCKRKYTIYDLQEMIEIYTAKIKELSNL